jgi:hypothetical protein
VGPGELVGRGERHVRAEQRLDAHRRDDARGPGQPVGVGQEQRPDPRHQLGPVQERQALLGLERERLEANLAQRDEARHALSAQVDPAASDDRQREVGERREVARRADGALLWHHGMDAAIEEGEQPVDDDRPAAAVTEARVFARSSSIARTTSTGSGAPTPAA